ncbi:hypothetical protein NLX83_23880 [Allokutzneria sp. A3M-2-11 16]|uniref:hypothetical protein n=1 Tax=Allokutzneria sp. A3M-2-11 16 TaxID=2962043 RepID=UPI0020B65949|nr:hypothetical protein [Allokutzneria sp. A3M-2-11 16]MCP3802315.1 hypothetical protein [Allokutzneria sp. A3M-2-11 16]
MSELEEVRAGLHAVREDIPLAQVAEARLRLTAVHAELAAAWAKTCDSRPDKARHELALAQKAVRDGEATLRRALGCVRTATAEL